MPRVALWAAQMVLGGVAGSFGTLPILRTAVHWHTEPLAPGPDEAAEFGSTATGWLLFYYRSLFIQFGCLRNEHGQPVLLRSAFEA